jgi:hypothetical protein
VTVFITTEERQAYVRGAFEACFQARVPEDEVARICVKLGITIEEVAALVPLKKTKKKEVGKK